MSISRRMLQAVAIFSLLLISLPVRAQNDPALADPAAPVQPEPAPAAADEAPPEEQTPETEKLPLLEDLDWPAVESLLTGAPEDWIVLHTGRVLQVPSLFPRPDHLGWLEAERKKLQDIRPRDPAELPAWLTEYERFNSILVAVSEEGLEADYLLPVRYVDRILHHEDLALLRARESLKQGDILDARRLIDVVSQSEYALNRRRREQNLDTMNWPGLLEARRALVAAETRKETERKAFAAGFHLLTLYGQQDRDFDELPTLFGEVLKPLSQKLQAEQRYRELRYYLDQTRSFFPNHPVATEVANALRSQAAEKIQDGEQAAQRDADRQAALAGYEGLWIWPRDAELTRRAVELQERYPILRVGVIPTQSTLSWYRSSLTDHQWFEIDSIKQGYPRYRSRFVESWIPHDLGRSIDLTFRLQPGVFDSQPAIGSRELFDVLAAASLNCPDPEQGLYAPQLTELARTSPYAITFKVRDQTPHPFNFLAAMLKQAPANRPVSLKQTRFTTEGSNSEELLRVPDFIARRAVPAQATLGQGPVAEVHEFAYQDAPALLRGLLRDEVDYVPDVPAEYIRRLQTDRRFTVSRYQLGLTQRLQFRLTGRLREHPELRLALCLMLDRDALLQQIAPTDSPAREWYRRTNSITPRGSHGHQPLDSLNYDPIAARSLTRLLSQKPDFPRQLVLLAPNDRDSRQATEFIAAAWQQLGMETRIVSESISSTAVAWDARLDTSPLLSPWADLPGLLSEDGRITTADLEAIPRPLRVSLWSLEQAYDWQDVNASLGELQRFLLTESWVLPLWERSPHQVVRREIRNLPDRVLRPAQSVDRWIVPPQPPRQ